MDCQQSPKNERKSQVLSIQSVAPAFVSSGIPFPQPVHAKVARRLLQLCKIEPIYH